ncbi:MAG: hypothetical protein HYU80_00995 [Candidatus Blackburnbacteria bacterium]|nr:hypothetical protein [Candidatus Blackburnbacteria bacterium]
MNIRVKTVSTEQLTPRQVQILKDVVEEYIKTALPVGSDNLDRKYNLGVSPATIRNEMNELTRLDYLRQPHTSAGRVPTPRAIRFYVDQLMQEKQLSVTDEVAAKQRVFEVKDDFDRLMQETTRALAQLTKSLAVAVTEDDGLWHSGYANILSNPEFYNIDVTFNVLSILEQVPKVRELLLERMNWDEPVGIVFGEQVGWANFEPVGIVVGHFATPSLRGCIGVIGPVRLNYSVVVPLVKYFNSLVSEATK